MGEKVYVGVDMGGTNVCAAVVNIKGQILSRAKKRTAGVTSREGLFSTIALSVEQALLSAGTSVADLAGIGVGAPGPVDTKNGIVLEMPNIPVGRLHLRSGLEAALGVPCFVENDVNLGTFGEFWRGAGRGARHLFGVFVGTGTGGGVIVDGKILRGKNGITGEIGHIVLDPDGPVCGCGRRGCLESLASRTAMQRAVKEAISAGVQTILADLTKGDYAKLRSGVFKKALDRGDALAEQVVRDCAIHLGYGAVTVIHLINPERIVFGGGVMEALADYMLPIVRQVVDERCLSGTAEGIEIVPAKLGDDAGVLGAAAMTMQVTGELPE